MTPETLAKYRSELGIVCKLLKINNSHIITALCKTEQDFLKEFENLSADKTLKKLASIKLYLLAKAENPIFEVYSKQEDLNEIYNELIGLYEKEKLSARSTESK